MSLYLLKHTIDVCFQGIKLSYHIVGAFFFYHSGVMALKLSICYVFKDASPDTGSISAMNSSVLLPGEDITV